MALGLAMGNDTKILRQSVRLEHHCSDALPFPGLALRRIGGLDATHVSLG